MDVEQYFRAIKENQSGVEKQNARIVVILEELSVGTQRNPWGAVSTVRVLGIINVAEFPFVACWHFSPLRDMRNESLRFCQLQRQLM